MADVGSQLICVAEVREYTDLFLLVYTPLQQPGPASQLRRGAGVKGKISCVDFFIIGKSNPNAVHE